MSTQIVNILNTVRDNASVDFQNNVPQATLANLQEFGNPILNDTIFANEFLNVLVNRIAFTWVQNKIYKNPLAPLKKGQVTFGTDIQEIYTNPSKASKYDGDNMSSLLTKTSPDVKAAYHRRNRQDKYSVTIYADMLEGAFTSFEKMQELITSITNSMYSGNYIDEYELTKNLFSTAVTNDIVVIENTVEPTDELTGKTFVKQIKKLVSRFKFASTKYNKYSDLVGATGEPVKTFTNPEDIILIIKSDIMADIDVDVLSVAFNLDKVTFLGNVFEVDEFEDDNIQAIIADKSWVQLYDNKLKMTEFYNGATMSWNYWLHVWQTYSLSPFANAVALVSNYVEPSVTSVSISPMTTTVAKGATKQFTSTVVVVGTASQDVNYTITGNAKNTTSISSTGLLTIGADETATTVTVTSTSVADTTKTAISTVTVA